MFHFITNELFACSSEFSLKELEETSSKKPDLKDCQFFVRRVLKTNVALVFKLNSQVVDVLFFDGKKLVFDYKTQLVTFVNKNGERIVRDAIGIAETGQHEFLKYLKYVQKLFQKLSSKVN